MTAKEKAEKYIDLAKGKKDIALNLYEFILDIKQELNFKTPESKINYNNKVINILR
jgi:hypothetical protein